MNATRSQTLGTLEHEVGVVIRRVKRVIGERARAVHEDLQPASYLVLTYLETTGACRSSAIAGAFDMDKGAISRLVQHLDELGLIERTPDPADGRAALLSVTDDARRRMADVQKHRRKYLDERLADWSDEDLRAFVDMLGRYNASLDPD
ncbi:MAG: MarR family transcriptional regulator [Nocardioides sp.]